MISLLGLVVVTSVSTQQLPNEIRAAVRDLRVQEALQFVDEHEDRAAQFLREIGGIISPSGQEQDRAVAVAARMRAIGLHDVRVDEGPNAVGRIPGRSGQVVVLISTLDDLATVAEHQRASGRPPTITADRVVGPGTNTSLSTAALVTAAEALIHSGVRLEHDLVFAAVARRRLGSWGCNASTINSVIVLYRSSTCSVTATAFHTERLAYIGGASSPAGQLDTP